MLYSVSEKLLSAPDIKDIGTLVCDEAQRFLRSDSVSVLLLNEETGNLELVRWRGHPFHSRSSIEVGEDPVGAVRSDERRVGTEWVCTCGPGWWGSSKKKKNKNT